MEEEINLKGVQLLLVHNDSEAREAGQYDAMLTMCCWLAPTQHPQRTGLKVRQDPWTDPAKIFSCGVFLRLFLRMRAAISFAIWLWFALTVSSFSHLPLPSNPSPPILLAVSFPTLCTGVGAVLEPSLTQALQLCHAKSGTVAHIPTPL